MLLTIEGKDADGARESVILGSLFPGNFRSGRTGFTFSVVRFPFFSVVARPGSMVNGSMFASLVGLG